MEIANIPLRKVMASQKSIVLEGNGAEFHSLCSEEAQEQSTLKTTENLPLKFPFQVKSFVGFCSHEIKSVFAAVPFHGKTAVAEE